MPHSHISKDFVVQRQELIESHDFGAEVLRKLWPRLALAWLKREGNAIPECSTIGFQSDIELKLRPAAVMEGILTRSIVTAITRTSLPEEPTGRLRFRQRPVLDLGSDCLQLTNFVASQPAAELCNYRIKIRSDNS